MSTPPLNRLLDRLIAGEISSEEHESLQAILKQERHAREEFRQRIDLESGLRVWASEFPDDQVGITIETEVDLVSQRNSGRTQRRDLTPPIALATLAASVLFAIASISWFTAQESLPLADSGNSVTPGISTIQPALGRLIEQPDCRWQIKPVAWSGTFKSGLAVLEAGAAELRFASGTNLILEAPCNLTVTGESAAKLHDGNLAVHVTELSKGFTLRTPESEIIDEGTEYVVSVTNDATEVHVFDGSVRWVPTLANERDSVLSHDRVEEGQAKRYARLAPAKGKIIPFGQRKFVRTLEQNLRLSTNGQLIAYDGFENLASRIRRGRSGFGWSGGWIPTGQRRILAAETVASAPGTVFGINRDQRRLMKCLGGADLRRELASSLTWEEKSKLYLSFILRLARSKSPIVELTEDPPTDASARAEGEVDDSFRMTLEPDLPGRAKSRHAVASFGIASDRVPFLQSQRRVSQAESPVLPDVDYLFVIQLPSANSGQAARMRVIDSSEEIEPTTSDRWTVEAELPVEREAIRSVRITVGRNAVWQIDELRLGSSWNSVIGAD